MVEKYTITKKQEVFDLLKEKRNFSLMNSGLLKRLINEMKIVRFTKKTLLIKQNEENRFIYIIVKGGVTVYVDKKPLYMLRRTGDVFGELSFVNKSPSTASVVAEPDTGVMAISFKYLKKMNDIEFALWLCRVVGEKLIRTSKLKTAEGDPSQEKAAKPKAAKAPAPVAETVPEEEESSDDQEILDGQRGEAIQDINAEDSVEEDETGKEEGSEESAEPDEGETPEESSDDDDENGEEMPFMDDGP